MGFTTLLALIGGLRTLIKDEPEIVATFKMIEDLLLSGKEPTQEQWAQLDVALAASHAALQAA